MDAKDLTQHQKDLIKEVAEKLALSKYRTKLSNLDSVKQNAIYMLAVQKFLNEEVKNNEN